MGFTTSYTPYGDPFEQYGDLNSLLGFTGEQTDPTGMLFLRARYYNPNTGTFLSKDPAEGYIGGESIRWNGYSYVHANPVNFTDPSGQVIPLLPIVIAVGVGAIIGAVIGAAAYILPKVINNIQNGNCIFEDVELGELVEHVVKGAVIGAVGGLAYGIGLSVGGAIFGKAILTAIKVLPLSAGAILALVKVGGFLVVASSGALAGQASRVATQLMYPDADVDYLQPDDMLLDALLAVGLFRVFGGSFARVVVPRTIVFNNPSTLQHEFQHARQFGVGGNWNKGNAQAFENALRNHVSNSNTQQIVGTFRGTQPVIHYWDPKTNLWVATDMQGAFKTAWQLGIRQVQNLLRNGNVQ